MNSLAVISPRPLFLTGKGIRPLPLVPTLVAIVSSFENENFDSILYLQTRLVLVCVIQFSTYEMVAAVLECIEVGN